MDGDQDLTLVHPPPQEDRDQTQECSQTNESITHSEQTDNHGKHYMYIVLNNLEKNKQ